MKNEKLFMILAYPIIILVGLVAAILLAAPIVLYAFPQIHKFFIVSNMVITPHVGKDMTSFGLHGREVYISAGSTTIAVWHFVPLNDQGKPVSEDFASVLADEKYKIVMYFQSKGTRDWQQFAKFGRVLLNRTIQIVSFDYKGFGNAAGETTRMGAIEDTRTVFNWLRRHAHNSEIHFWAHGLGAGIAASALEALLHDGQEVRSIVLEAPYANTHKMLEKSFWMRVYGPILPKSFFTTAFDIIDLNFDTTKSISNVNVPTLVLNGESDNVTLPDNSRQLVAEARRHRDFIFHIEWRCKIVKNWPGSEASKNELEKIITGFHNATGYFWEP